MLPDCDDTIELQVIMGRVSSGDQQVKDSKQMPDYKLLLR